MCNFDFGSALCHRSLTLREEHRRGDGYTGHTIPTLYTRCFRRLRGVVVGRMTGLAGRVKQEWGIVYGGLERDDTSLYLSKVLPLYDSVMSSACCAAYRIEYLSLKIDKDLGNRIYFGFGRFNVI